MPTKNYFISKLLANFHYYYCRTIKHSIFHESDNILPRLPREYLYSTFAGEKSDLIFVHAGLSRIKRITGVENPYSHLLGALRNHYHTILTPGFTPSFRNSGIYHKKYSLPEYGAWSKLFLNDATARTDDAIHSILQIGDYDFSSCDHRDSFGKNSCFYKLIRDNVLVANIGTDDFVCTFIHAAECINGALYVASDEKRGIIYYDDVNFSHITQINYKLKMRYAWNRSKIVRDLKTNNVLRDYSENGFVLYFFGAGDLFDFLSVKMKKDPWYLIK